MGGAKRNLTSLTEAQLVDDEQRRRLADRGITTVEELLGELRADPEGVQRLLDLSAPAAERLLADAHGTLPAATREAFDAMPEQHEQAYGARNPDEHEG